MPENRFWEHLDQLAARCPLRLDRPRGSHHPRYAGVVYPLDYGYLEGTRSGDQGGVDVWLGSLPGRELTGLICTVDLNKHDVEVKLLLGCTPAESRTALEMHNQGNQSGLLLLRPQP